MAGEDHQVRPRSIKYRERAVVLRHQQAREHDWTVTLLTRDHHVLTALLKYAQRPSNRLRPRLRVGAHVDVELYRGNVITHVQPVDAVLTHAYVPAMMEAAELLAEEGPCGDLYWLTVTTLRAKVAPGPMFASYLLRAMELSGWGLALAACACCGAPGPHKAFHVAAGGSVCLRCRPPGAIVVELELVELLAALRGEKWVVVEAAPASLGARATGLIVAHFQQQVECQLERLP